MKVSREEILHIANLAQLELKEEEKFEVSIIDLHPVVKEYVEKNVITNTSHFKRNSNEGYELGIAMGSKYNFMNKKGIE